MSIDSNSEMDRLSILIIDDNEQYLMFFSRYVKNYCEKNNIKIQMNMHSSIKDLDLVSAIYDIAFLDIDMPSISGFAIAKHLKRICHTCSIVYVSAKTELVFDSFDYSTVENFIPKGSSEETLKRKMHQIFIKKIDSFYRINENGIKIDIPKRNIIYLEKNHNDLYIHCTKKEYKLRCNLKTVLNDLNNIRVNFVQIHKSFAVNLMFIQSFDNNRISLSNGQVVLVSRRYQKHFKTIYENRIVNYDE